MKADASRDVPSPNVIFGERRRVLKPSRTAERGLTVGCVTVVLSFVIYYNNNKADDDE